MKNLFAVFIFCLVSFTGLLGCVDGDDTTLNPAPTDAGVDSSSEDGSMPHAEAEVMCAYAACKPSVTKACGEDGVAYTCSKCGIMLPASDSLVECKQEDHGVAGSGGSAGQSGSSGSNSGTSGAAGSIGSAGSAGVAGTSSVAGMGGAGGSAQANLCIPGAAYACACPQTTKLGTQVCANDGQSLGACTGCPAIPSGMAGSGGASGSGGEAGAAGATASGGCKADTECQQSDPCVPNICHNGVCEPGADACEASGHLVFRLGSVVTSSTYVKKSFDVAAVSFTFTNLGPATKRVQRLAVNGRAKVTGCGFGDECAKQEFRTRVANVSVFMGDTKIALSQSPSLDGTTMFEDLDFVVLPGESKTIVVKVSLGSQVSAQAPFDQIAIGWQQVLVTNVDGTYTHMDLTDDLSKQNGSNPYVVQTIVPSGTLTVQADNLPASAILVAGKNTWDTFAQYKLTAQYEDMKIDRAAIVQSSPYAADDADLTQVAIGLDEVKGLAVLPPGTQGTTDVDLSGHPLTIPKDSSIVIQVWGKTAPVVSYDTNPAASGVARSGHAPALGLWANATSGEWDASYAGKLNLRTTGQTSQERVYANSDQAGIGNPMVIMKAKPVIAQQPLSTTAIFNGKVDLLKFQVGADGQISFPGMNLWVTKTSEVSLSNFRLRRGNTDLGAWADVVGAGSCMTPYCITSDFSIGSKSGNVIFYLDPESHEQVSGAGNVYTISADVSGAVTGSMVTIELKTDAGPVMGDIAKFPDGNWLWHVCSDPNQLSSCHGANFPWSDLSGTDVYTNGWLVKGLPLAQTLSLLPSYLILLE
jgi:hypothetical protein